MVRVPLLAVLGLEVESVAGPGLELGLDGVESVLDLEHPSESVRVGVAKPTLLLDVLVDVLRGSLGRDLGGDAVDERLEGTALVVIAAVPEQIGLVAAAVRVDLVEPDVLYSLVPGCRTTVKYRVGSSSGFRPACSASSKVEYCVRAKCESPPLSWMYLSTSEKVSMPASRPVMYVVRVEEAAFGMLQYAG